jgi:glycosyltransferase involved in cell wall biosynthesis
MKTPIIIPAYNEERTIAKTLESLPSDLTEPFVAVNGSTDDTASIAEELGATVFHFEEQGKIPAVQGTLKELGDRALDPLIILDADTRPLMPERWHNNMLRLLGGARPATVGGPVVFNESGLANSTIRSIFALAHNYKIKSRVEGTDAIGQAGPNMGLHIHDPAILEGLFELPHLWPAGDQAIVHVIKSNGGNYFQPLSPGLLAITRMHESWLPISEQIKVGSEEADRRSKAHYVERAAPGAQQWKP